MGENQAGEPKGVCGDIEKRPCPVPVVFFFGLPRLRAASDRGGVNGGGGLGWAGISHVDPIAQPNGPGAKGTAKAEAVCWEQLASLASAALSAAGLQSCREVLAAAAKWSTASPGSNVGRVCQCAALMGSEVLSRVPAPSPPLTRYARASREEEARTLFILAV